MTAAPSPEQVLATHSKSFALASTLLPKPARADAAVLYAWCRRADDAIDLGEPQARPARLAELRRELASVYAGEPQLDPLLREFQRVVSARRIPIDQPSALLDGMQTDLGRVRFETVSELLLYSYRVAGVVGLMMCPVLGARDPRAHENAVHLGIAMQITNICRDVLEDWERQRLYLPEELLREVGAPALGSELGGALGGRYRKPLALAVRRLLELAERYYRSGDRGLPALPARAAWGVRAARLVYAEIGAELARRGHDVFAGRARVSRWRKLVLVARAAVQELSARWFGGKDDRSVLIEA